MPVWSGRAPVAQSTFSDRLMPMCPRSRAETLTMTIPSVIVLLILFFLLAVAVGMFWTLVWRETSNRRSVALAEWARASRFKFAPDDADPPAPLPALGSRALVISCLVGRRCTLAQAVIERASDV